MELGRRRRRRSKGNNIRLRPREQIQMLHNNALHARILSLYSSFYGIARKKQFQASMITSNTYRCSPHDSPSLCVLTCKGTLQTSPCTHTHTHTHTVHQKLAAEDPRFNRVANTISFNVPGRMKIGIKRLPL